jgi:hypothetical protein
MTQHPGASPDIFICLAYDGVLLDILPLFNADLAADVNDWRARGYKERARWGFLNELPKGGGPGRGPLLVSKPRLDV